MPTGLRRVPATAPTMALPTAKQAAHPSVSPDNLSRYPFILSVARRKQTQGVRTDRIRIVLLSAKVQFEHDELYLHTQRGGRMDTIMFTRDSPGRLTPIGRGASKYVAYIPDPLPPRLELDTDTLLLLSQACLLYTSPSPRD